jgi:ABC-type uncharacterized transport system permease subunit
VTAYLALAGKAFRRALAYRMAFWTELAINLLFMLLYVYLWRELTRGSAAGDAISAYSCCSRRQSVRSRRCG